MTPARRTLAWALALLLALAAAPAFARAPLLLPGKTTLFERVLTRPGAAPLKTPTAAPGDPLDPFTPLYVYGRTQPPGGPALIEVGTDAKGTTVGFLPETQTIPWRHAMVLAFADRAGRDRALFFRDQAALQGWQDAPDPGPRADAARQAITGGTLPADSPVLSIEPQVPVDFETNFYMLPILDAQTRRLPSGFAVRNLQVASVTRDDQPLLSRRVNADALKDFRAGVVFVIDASSSMQPYIERTRAVMNEVLDQTAREGLADRVRFGLVAYRDDPAKVAGIEYLTRTFADPNSAATRKDFAAAIAPLKASTVSTQDFAEDGFAALDTALAKIDWSGFGARSLVLITDASAREAGTPFASTGLNTYTMRQLVERNRTALYVLHLQTPAGKADHDRARSQYEVLSRYPNVGSLYYPVPAGDPAAFEGQVRGLTQALIAQVRDAGNAASPATPPAPGLTGAAAQIGRAMALAYLGRVQGAQAPTMFSAWTQDRDIAKPDLAAFSVRVLLSKNQLSDLQRTLQVALQALEQGQIDPSDLFNQLRSASVAMGRDPSRVGQGAVRDLQSTGLMGEYLDGLPYQSPLMALNADDWVRMGVNEQEAMIRDIGAKLRLYQRFHDQADRWIALTPNADPGDRVYPVPIDVLP